MKQIILILTIFTISSFSIYSNEKISLTFAGDLMAHDVNYTTKPLSDIYNGVKDDLLKDDLSFVNLEFPIDETKKQTSYPAFNVHPEYVQAAIDGGFDIFSMANNHTNDYGNPSLVKTIENMNKFKVNSSVVYSGIYRDEKKGYRLEVITVKGVKIGFLAVSQFNNNYWDKVGAKKVYIVDFKDEQQVLRLKEFTKTVSGKVDCLILSYHGGAEYKNNPSLERKEFFNSMLDAGVDIMWGHHPHVLQPWFKKSTETGDKLVMYSMGNFISGQLAIVNPLKHNINFAATGFSSLLKVDIQIIDNKLKIVEVEPKMIANVRNKNNYFVTVFKDVALTHPMSENWKAFYKKMFPIAEHRFREDDG